MNPDGSMSPGVMNFAITPAMNPMRHLVSVRRAAPMYRAVQKSDAFISYAQKKPQSGINRTQSMLELRQARARLRSIRRRDRQATLLTDRLATVSLTSRHMVAATILPSLTCHPNRTNERRVGAVSMAGECLRELSKVDTVPCLICARVK
jgi:hypothetical protein